MHEGAADKVSDEASLYVGSVDIGEIIPSSLHEARLEAAVLRSFLNVFNNQLYILIKNSRDALKQITSDHGIYGQLRDIASAVDELESAIKRLQSLVEGPPGFNGTGTILVADDQDAVRNLVVKTLEGHGYTVFGATSGLEALAKCKAYPGPIDLLIADVGMEPMDGYELVRSLLMVRQNTKAIYMSGNFLDHKRAMAGTAFLLKGNELVDGLLKKVRQMLSTS
jgi:CheY-like chemotaxis protein